jgi:hypothetical protein
MPRSRAIHQRATTIKLAHYPKAAPSLEDLPGQAKRLARWQARRNRITNSKFTSPLRQGPPAGHRKELGHEVDFVLRKWHALARDALREDSS